MLLQYRANFLAKNNVNTRVDCRRWTWWMDMVSLLPGIRRTSIHEDLERGTLLEKMRTAAFSDTNQALSWRCSQAAILFSMSLRFTSIRDERNDRVLDLGSPSIKQFGAGYSVVTTRLMGLKGCFSQK